MKVMMALRAYVYASIPLQSNHRRGRQRCLCHFHRRLREEGKHQYWCRRHEDVPHSDEGGRVENEFVGEAISQGEEVTFLGNTILV